MDYTQLVRNWHLKAGDDDYFSKYVFEYLAFVGFLKRVKYVDQNLDSNAIRELKRDTYYKDEYLALVKEKQELNQSWQIIKEELDTRPLGTLGENGEIDTIWYWECSHAGKENPREHICVEQGKIRDLSDWVNMIEFWHSIRNNLFHGAKNPDDRRDRLLVENGYKTLRLLVDVLLNS
ncbi:MAG: hypothetical protein WAN50_04205 [Minisyncoccia bacterium]